MGALFYDHLTRMETLYTEIELLSLDRSEKIIIIDHIEARLHHQVLEVVLDHLPPSDHQYFLELFHQQPHHHQLLDFLKSKIIGIEDKIKTTADEIKYDTLCLIRSHS